MAKKSNKTDHVLNLLSSGGKKSAAKKEPKEVKEEPPVEILEEEIEEETEYEAEAEDIPVKKTTGKKSAAKKKANVSVVYKAAEEESPIAEAVKDSLEQEFDAYLKEKETQLKENVAKAEAKIKEDVEKTAEAKIAAEEQKNQDIEEKDEAVRTAREKIQLAELDVRALMMQVQEEEEVEETVAEEPEEPEVVSEPEAEETEVEIQEETLQNEEKQPETVQEEVKLRPIPQMSADQPKVVTDALSAQQGLIDDVLEDTGYVTLNIMEILVKMMTPELVRQFGHCDCRRCMADTIALALTNLPAKYVVVNKGTESPLINYYERKYSGQLTVEITKASMIVHENPHH